MGTGLSIYGAENIGRIPGGLAREFNARLADHLRTGIHVTKLDGLAAWSVGETTYFVNHKENERTILKKQIRAVRRDHKFNLREKRNAKTKRAKKRWAQEADEVATQLEELEDRLDDLNKTKAPVRMPDAFESEVDFLLKAIDATTEHTGSMPQDLVSHYQTIVVDRRLYLRLDGGIDAEASALLPADGGVVKLGPIRWSPTDQPELSVPLMWACLEENDQPAPWQEQPRPPKPKKTGKNKGRATGATGFAKHYAGDRISERGRRHLLLEQLDDIGCAEEFAYSLLACGFPAAPYVVIAHGRGEAPPDWVGEQWADPNWMAWLHASYVAAPLRCTGRGRHAEPSWLRQRIIDLTLDAGGYLSFANLVPALAGNGYNAYGIRRVLKTDGPHTPTDARPWLPPVDRQGFWPVKGNGNAPAGYGVKLIECDRCGRAAELATRATELLGDALCPEGHLVRARRVLTTNDSLDLFAAAQGAAESREETSALRPPWLRSPDGESLWTPYPDPHTITVPTGYQWLRVPRSMHEHRVGRRPSAGQGQLDISTEPKRERKYRQLSELTDIELCEVAETYNGGGVTIRDVASRWNLNPTSLSKHFDNTGVRERRRNKRQAPDGLDH